MGAGASKQLLAGLDDREHPLAHQPKQVRRGYDIAKQAATDLDPDNPVFLTWRAEAAGAGVKYPIQYPKGPKWESTLTQAGNRSPLHNSMKRLEHGPCLPIFLKANYISMSEALEKAQHHAFQIAPARWYELQRADDLSRFLMRQDVSVLSKEEVGDLGEALRHVRIAGANVRADSMMPLKKNEQGIPGQLEASLQTAHKYAKVTAAHAFRCRDNEFLPPLLPGSSPYVKEEGMDSGCTVM